MHGQFYPGSGRGWGLLLTRGSFKLSIEELSRSSSRQPSLPSVRQLCSSAFLGELGDSRWLAARCTVQRQQHTGGDIKGASRNNPWFDLPAHTAHTAHTGRHYLLAGSVYVRCLLMSSALQHAALQNPPLQLDMAVITVIVFI